MDYFHWTPEQISKLTDRQITELCFHPRDEHGAIKYEKTVVVKEPQSMEEELKQLKRIVNTVNAAAMPDTPGRITNSINMINPESIKACEEKIRKKWQEKASQPNSEHQ